MTNFYATTFVLFLLLLTPMLIYYTRPDTNLQLIKIIILADLIPALILAVVSQLLKSSTSREGSTVEYKFIGFKGDLKKFEEKINLQEEE